MNTELKGEVQLTSLLVPLPKEGRLNLFAQVPVSDPRPVLPRLPLQ